MTGPKNAAASSGVSIDREHEEFGKWKDSRPDLKAGTSSRDWDLAWLAWWNRASAAPEAVVPRIDADKLRREIMALLWNEHQECCGSPVVGAEYMGQQEMICCGCPNHDMLNDAQIVASLRAMFPESGHRDARHAAAELVSLCATSKDGVQPTERRSITVSVGELRASDGTTYCVSLYKPGENIGEGMCVLNTPNKQNAEDEAQAWREWLGIAGVAPTPVPLAELRRLIADDAYAATFQTFGQYRTALLKAIDASGVNTLEPLDRIQRCTLGCGELGQCKANAHGVPSECPARNAGVDLPDGAKR